jgi:hypothetical protein
MSLRRFIPLSLALATALAALAAPTLSDAGSCRAGRGGVCVHAGAPCQPPRRGACQTVASPIPGRHLHYCLCGTPGKPILLP